MVDGGFGGCRGGVLFCGSIQGTFLSERRCQTRRTPISGGSSSARSYAPIQINLWSVGSWVAKVRAFRQNRSRPTVLAVLRAPVMSTAPRRPAAMR